MNEPAPAPSTPGERIAPLLQDAYEGLRLLRGKVKLTLNATELRSDTPPKG